MTTTTKPSKAARFRDGQRSVETLAAMLEDDIAAEFERAFTRTARAMTQTLTAASDWNLPDADELFDSQALEAEINQMLSEAKTALDVAMAEKLGEGVAGQYSTESIASLVASRHREEVQQALQESWGLGESVDQAAARLGDIGKVKSQLIARTTLNGMSNATSLSGAQFAGMKVKRFINGEQKPLDAAFSNGCRFPGDPSGRADEVINCRCIVIYTDHMRDLPPGEEQGLDYTGYQRPSDTLTGWDDSEIGGTGRHVMGVIDQTHRAPLGMGSTPVTITEKGLGAEFRASVRETSMAVSRNAKWPNMTIAHEFGHKLDYAGSPGWFSMRKAAVMTTKNAAGEWVPIGPELSEAFGGWLRAVRRSAGYKTIETERAGYFKDVKELWARSYSQWLAERSGDPKLLAELADMRAQAPGSTFYFPQWSDADFAEISAAIDRIMRTRGLID
jgi:hypothetical protein